MRRRGCECLIMETSNAIMVMALWMQVREDDNGCRTSGCDVVMNITTGRGSSGTGH